MRAVGGRAGDVHRPNALTLCTAPAGDVRVMRFLAPVGQHSATWHYRRGPCCPAAYCFLGLEALPS